jgi:hypothetical protein
MKVLLNKINIYEVEQELEVIQAEKVSNTTTSFEIFDIEEHTIFKPLFVPSRFQTLFYALNLVTTNKLTLAQQNLKLFLKETEHQAEIVLQKLNSNNGTIPQESIRVKINSEEVANIEELFLTSGLQMLDRYEVYRSLYAYKPLQSFYDVYKPSAIPPYLQVESPSEEQMIQSLALIGFTIDQATSPLSEEILQ